MSELTSRPVVSFSIVAVLLALVIRVAWSVWTEPVPPTLSDADYYNATALSIARGLGFSVTFRGNDGWLLGGDPTSFWPPGYSAYLGLAYRAFGEDLWVARFSNILVGALTMVPVYVVGRRLFDDPSARCGVVIAAFLPSFVFWTPVLLSDTLFTFLFACSLALLLYAFDGKEATDRRRTSLCLIIGGLAIGVSTLVRGQGLVLLPLAAVWWMCIQVPFRQVVYATLGMSVVTVAVLVPWAIRNTVLFDSPIFLSTNFGYNLRIGHAPYATGRYIVPQDLWDAEPGLSFKDREVLFNDEGRDRAIDYAGGNLRREVTLSLDKVEWLWRPDSDVLYHVSSYGATPLPSGAWERLRIILDSSYLILIGLALLAFLQYQRYGRSLVFPALLVAGWTVAHVVFFGEPRYHLPVLTVCVSMAGVTLVWIGKRLWQSAGALIE